MVPKNSKGIFDKSDILSWQNSETFWVFFLQKTIVAACSFSLHQKTPKKIERKERLYWYCLPIMIGPNRTAKPLTRTRQTRMFQLLRADLVNLKDKYYLPNQEEPHIFFHMKICNYGLRTEKGEFWEAETVLQELRYRMMPRYELVKEERRKIFVAGRYFQMQW